MNELKSASDVIDARALVTLFALALLSLLPTFKPVQNYLHALFNRK